MKILKQNSGIDISKNDFYASLSVLKEDLEVEHLYTKKFPNTEEGIKIYYQWIKKHCVPEMPVHFTMEATGVYYEELAYFLVEQGEEVYILLPSRAKHFAQSLNLKVKTDKVDARSLGEMGLRMKFDKWEIGSKMYRELKALTRERTSLVEQQTRIKNELHAEKHKKYPMKVIVERYELHLAFLQDQITEIENQIKEIIAQDDYLKGKLKKVITIPGIGFLTAITIIAETYGFANFTSAKQLTSYAGYDIRIRESGQYRGKSRISKKGNTHIRRALYMPAITHKQYSEEAKIFYNRLKEKKSIGLIALTAVQRKLLILIYSLWKKDEIFIQNYQNQKSGKEEQMPSFC